MCPRPRQRTRGCWVLVPPFSLESWHPPRGRVQAECLTALLHGHFLLMPAHELLTKGCVGSILPHPTSTAGGSIRRHRHTSERVHRWWLITKGLTHNWVTGGAVFGQLGFEEGWSGLCIMPWRTPMQWHTVSQSHQLQSSPNPHFSELDVQKDRYGFGCGHSL